MRSNIILLTFAAVLTGTLHVEVKPNLFLSDGAVLQRGQKIPVWGTARDGWSNVPDVNLFNQQGLPASPFRTDVE